jgi:uncharacterized protein YaeQ
MMADRRAGHPLARIALSRAQAQSQVTPLAENSTVVKVELQISDMDRHYYQLHNMTLAKHPSETDERLMVRVLAFALNANDALEFGRGLSSDDEPDLWQRDPTGLIERWIEIGQPDEQRIRRACGRAREVRVYTYSGRGAQLWWEKNAVLLQRCRNLSVIDIPTAASQGLAALVDRRVAVQCLIQDGHIQIMDATTSIDIDPVVRM